MKHRVIALTDSSFLPGAKALARSYAANSGLDFPLTILPYELKELERQELLDLGCDLQDVHPPMKDLFSSLQGHSRTRWFMGAVWYLPQLFPDAERILYLDADIIVVGDLSDAFSGSMGSYHLAAVPAISNKSVYKQMNPGPEDEKYKEFAGFNGGVQLMNCPRWRDLNPGKAYVDALHKYPSKFQKMGGQSAQNYVEAGRWLAMGLEWHVPYRLSEWPENAKIIHYKGEKKPWNAKVKFQEEWLKYAH